MKKILQDIYFFLTTFGLNPIKTIQSLRGLPGYLKDYYALKKQSKHQLSKEFAFGKIYPFLSERFEKSGTASGHYFYQDLLIASRIFENRPERHVDVGSRIDGFVAHVATFRAIEVLDIRPLTSKIKNVFFKQADLMNELPDELFETCDSLSCLHALEHFGLGRYGDPINWEGYKIGFNNLYNMLKPNGKFYFSVPIGPQRIEFNAHRVFELQYLINMFAKRFIIENFSYVDDKGDLFENAELTSCKINTNFDCNYGCGIFELRKI